MTTVLLFSVPGSSVWAQPTTSSQAMAVVQAWRQMEAKPLKSTLGKTASAVQTFTDAGGTALYHVVSLDSGGFAIVPADDLIEPIIAFSSEGTFDPSDSNPLGALVSRDLPGRIAHARGSADAPSVAYSGAPTSEQTAALNKWGLLQGTVPAPASGLTIVSDMRVAPLIQSTWDQSTVNGNICYNYFTPNHDVTGCVATALSQLMRFYQLPSSSVGTASFTITVDGSSRSEALMGGNGAGGAYNWAQMPLVPDGTTMDTQRQAIGRLLHDTGTTVKMSYTAGSSSAIALDTATALTTTFGYSNAKKGFYSNLNIPDTERNAMVNPNLDAGLPVLFGIFGNGGHAVVADGYGYQSATLYHHLNMGWSGANNLWYNLPNINDSYYGFTSIQQVVYNIFTSGGGEIISGRVVDCAGAPAGGVTVTASINSTGMASTTTNSNGIYALKGLSSSTSYTITATKNGYTFTPQTAATGTSSDYSITVGNKWGVDFTNTTCSSSMLTFTFAGTGYGSVNSVLSGINCTGTTGSVCASQTFSNGSSVILTASPDSSSTYNSIFAGWSTNTAACPGTGACNVSMTIPVSVTGTFNRDMLVNFNPQINGTYGTILAALSAATSGQTIQVRDNSALTPFVDPLLINTSIFLKGGYSSGFVTNMGYTNTSGGLTIGNSGVLTVERIILQ